jgi:hypothetical protein
MRLKKRLAQFLAVALAFFLCPLFDALVDALLRHPLYLLLTMLALGLTVRALEPLARKRGWGSEGRLTRHLSRPRFIDQSKQHILNWGGQTSRE